MEVQEAKSFVLLNEASYMEEHIRSPGRYFHSLTAKGVLNEDQCSTIMQQGTEEYKIRKLLELISLHERGYDVFVADLKRQRIAAHVAVHLKKRVNEIVKKKESQEHLRRQTLQDFVNHTHLNEDMAKDILSQCNWDLRDSIDKTVQIGLCPNSVSTSDATPQDHTHDATPQDRTPDYEIGSTPGCHPKLLTGHSTSSGVYYDEDPFCGPLPPPPPPPSLETPPSDTSNVHPDFGILPSSPPECAPPPKYVPPPKYAPPPKCAPPLKHAPAPKCLPPTETSKPSQSVTICDSETQTSPVSTTNLYLPLNTDSLLKYQEASEKGNVQKENVQKEVVDGNLIKCHVSEQSGSHVCDSPVFRSISDMVAYYQNNSTTATKPTEPKCSHETPPSSGETPPTSTPTKQKGPKMVPRSILTPVTKGNLIQELDTFWTCYHCNWYNKISSMSVCERCEMLMSYTEGSWQVDNNVERRTENYECGSCKMFARLPYDPCPRMLVKQLGGLKLCYKCYRRRKGSHEDGVKDAAMTQGTQTGEAEGDNNTPVDKPTMVKLLFMVEESGCELRIINEIAPCWEVVASALDISSIEINIISRNHHCDVVNAAHTMLSSWIDQRSNVSWEVFVDALSRAGYEHLAHRVKSRRKSTVL